MINKIAEAKSNLGMLFSSEKIKEDSSKLLMAFTCVLKQNFAELADKKVRVIKEQFDKIEKL